MESIVLVRKASDGDGGLQRKLTTASWQLDDVALLPSLPSGEAQPQQHPPLPPLDYDITQRYRSLFYNISFILIINTAAPTVAFYVSRHYSNDSPATSYTWVTLALGVSVHLERVSYSRLTLSPQTLELMQWPYRTWQLSRDGFSRSAYPLTAPVSGGFFRKLAVIFGHLDL